MTLRAAGYGKSLRTVGEVSPSAHRNRVSYAWGGLREWYANGPLGLEQGFDVARPLAAHSAGPLTLSLARSGDLHAVLAAGARSVRFLAPGGRTVLRYGGLTATDARGRALHAWLSLRGARVLVHIEADGAAYPLHIDPTIEDAELTATGGGVDDDLGTSVAVSGSTIVLGAPYHAVAGKNEAGAVYVFSKPAAGDWEDATQTAELTASDAVEDGFLGVSVAVTSSTIVAGAAGHGSDAGAVYVFSKPASGDWKDATQTAELTVAGGRRSRSAGSLGGGVGRDNRRRGSRRNGLPGRRVHLHGARLGQLGKLLDADRRADGQRWRRLGPAKRSCDLRSGLDDRGRGGGPHSRRSCETGGALRVLRADLGRLENHYADRRVDRRRRRCR
jgi:hypothetical protein